MLTFITVVYRDELDYLQTQARSFDLYVDPAIVDTISIVVNDDAVVVNQIDTAWWGKFADRVQITQQLYPAVSGWDSQQLGKLLSASYATTEWSIALDAKTWFIRPIDYASFFNGKRAWASMYAIGPNHKQYFQTALDFVNQLYNIDMTVLVQSGVPYAFHTETVNDMIVSINRDFVDFFLEHVQHPTLLAEFYLYSAYVLKRYSSYNDLYCKMPKYNRVNIADTVVDQFDELFVRMHEPQILTASIHKRALKLLTAEQLAKWQEFLKQRRLI